MASIEYREYRESDAESFLRLHDSVFPPVSAEFWREFSRQDVTASVAIAGGEVVGAVPFHFRDLRIRPGVTVRVAWEWSVGVRQDLRGTGVGSRLMSTAKGFLRGRCVAMAVYRNDELSPPYRYYRRNGHQDLMFIRPWTWDGSALRGPAGQVESETWDGFLKREDEYLAVFDAAYAAYGGYPQRRSGYYGPAVNTPEYAELPVELAVLEQRDGGGALRGYAILGHEQASSTLHLMELATASNDLAVAFDLLTAFCSRAVERGARAVASVTDAWPYLPVLQALGFQAKLRAQSSMIVMLYPLDPEGMASVAWRESDATANLDVLAWTPRQEPEREVVLHRARSGVGRRVVLEMKEDALARLLTCRLDLMAALSQQSVTSVGADKVTLEAIARALPCAPWTYHYLDFV